MYDRTGCTITEDYKNYTVAVKFSGRKGVPYNFEQIKSAVDEVKPAHLQVNYEFQSNTWSEVQKNSGHGAMQKYLHGEVLKIMTAERGCM